MLKTFFIIFFVFLFTYKSNSEIITDFNVVNNHRISKETILIFSDIEIGKDYSVNDLNKIIQDLYSTNFFSNNSLDVTDGILIIDIQENKIIQQITINGIKKKPKYLYKFIIYNYFLLF